MYTRAAQLYDALYHFKNYSAESEKLHNLIQQHNPHATTLIDVACGTGKHLENLRRYYRVEGLDISRELLDIAHERCPEVTLYQDDMLTFSLARSYDVVTCLFSAIAYVKTPDNLERAVSSMARHLRPGGMLFVEPWFSPTNYWIGSVTANFVDQPELKVAWMYISEVEDLVSVLDIHYLVGAPQGITRFNERHEMGLFTHEEYVGAFHRAGLEVHYDPQGLWGRGMYLGIRGGGGAGK
jgi:ubiquinone/menaquinone biosynthesis C-methylase UbiE